MGVEWYHCAGALVLAATTAMGPTIKKTEGGEEDDDEEGFYVRAATEGYDRAAVVSDRLVSLASSRDGSTTFEELVRDHDIATKERILHMKEEAMEEWKEKRSIRSGLSDAPGVRQNDDRNGRRSLFRMHRNDVGAGNGSTARKTAIIDENMRRTVNGGSGGDGGNANDNVRPGQRPVGNVARRGGGYSTTRTTHVPTTTRQRGRNGPQDDAFDNFDVFTGEGDEGHDDGYEEEVPPTAYLPWGDEVLLAMGKDPGVYPACEPKRPPEMVQEMGSVVV